MESRRLISGRTRLFAGAALASAAFVVGVAPGLASAKTVNPKIQRAASMRHADTAPLSGAAKRAVTHGYLVPNQNRYDRQKARATRRAEATEALSAPATSGPLAPSKIRAWNGINNPNNAPPDETSAVGTGRYIELVNSNFAIYNKTGTTPVGTGSLNSLIGAPSGVDVFDPQIMWDATTKRFYYAADAVVDPNTDNRVAFGFSKTATPASAADWCQFTVSFNSTFPDYPKLGDSQFFAIFGTNLFDTGGNYVGSHIEALSKPKASDTCTTYANTVKADGKVVNGGFTPTPASEIDNNGTGWAVARTLGLPSTQLKLYKITKNSTGAPVIGATPTSVTVPSYTMPPSIPQKGTTFRIDSSDTRNTQAQAGIDPGHGNKFALWTQHTVRGGVGGNGAEVRWYEIDPANHTVIQKGKATSPSLYEFNGAIAPNRQVNGSTKTGGSSMLMNFNTSSSTTFPSIKMVSKVGSNGQSGQVGVFTGTKPLTGFDCTAPAPDPCRWGDYAAVTPDPSAANTLWNVSQFGAGSPTSTFATSRTLNFVAKP